MYENYFMVALFFLESGERGKYEKNNRNYHGGPGRHWTGNYPSDY